MNIKAKLGGLANCKPWTREEIAARAARDIPEGFYVNLGIGIPVLVANYIPPEREVVIQSENGILGMGPEPPPDKINRWLINASKKYVTLVPGGSYVHHADSFAMIRGGHLDLCVLGAFQVAVNGDFADWSKSATTCRRSARHGPRRRRQERLAVDGSHDQGRREQIAAPLHLSGHGGRRRKRVYTNLAVLDVIGDAFAVCEMAPGISFEALQNVTDAPLMKAA